MARTPRTPAADAAPPPAPAPEPTARAQLPRRSMGLKLLLVCGLAVLMSVPAMFVFGLLWDRTNRAEQVTEEIGDLMGGQQTFLGPVIAVPYTLPANAPRIVSSPVPTRGAENLIWYVFPTRGRVDVATDSELRRRSLFRVAVYEAQLTYSAVFDMTRAGSEAPPGATLDWSRAELILGATDARGARSDIALAVGGRPAVLTPSRLDPQINLSYMSDDLRRDRRSRVRSELTLFGTPLTAADRAAERLTVTGRTAFSGAERVAVVAFAGTTEATVKGDWPHPSYNGRFLPARQTSTEGGGFEARWSVPSIARSVAPEGDGDALARLGDTELGVSFVEPANPYQSVGRSLKYAPMFIGIVFLAFFLFETATRQRVHPAQYVLVGLVQVVFYMLLLSIAEYIGFHLAFLIAATATVALISAYAGWTFESRNRGFWALGAFSALYGLIYLLMRLQEGAFIVGALTVFAALAAVMYFTRKVDWYGVTGTGAKDIA